MWLRLWEVFLIASGLALDVFAYMLWRGAMMAELKKTVVLKLLLIFTGFQLGGLLLGRMVASIPLSVRPLNGLWIVAAACIFFGLGIYMIIKALLKKNEVIVERIEGKLNYKMAFLWAFITSLDAVLAGVSFALLPVSLVAISMATVITTAIATVAGLCAGYWMGCAGKHYLVLVGGLVVICGGIDIMTHYFMVW
ncbi:MAG: manganese efflux pump [Lachnospiraceae bacterium]|nr:manganese efflux pump [Lachnospiraceae bacterium]